MRLFKMMYRVRRGQEGSLEVHTSFRKILQKECRDERKAK